MTDKGDKHAVKQSVVTDELDSLVQIRTEDEEYWVSAPGQVTSTHPTSRESSNTKHRLYRQNTHVKSICPNCHESAANLMPSDGWWVFQCHSCGDGCHFAGFNQVDTSP